VTDTLDVMFTPDATILAKHFTPGRPEPIRLVVIHTTENACALHVARNVALWFAGASAPQASAHYVVGPDEVIACVREEDTAWQAPPTNPYAIGVEHAARAADEIVDGKVVAKAFTADDWAGDAAQAMIAKSVELVADLCVRHNIPAVFVDKDGLVRGDAGITTHITISHAFGKTDHVDPGPNFPIDDYLARVAAAVADRAGGAATDPAPAPTDPTDPTDA
jgi:N-acetyl-anhydromuramyl-L-alanine amidase AmpD